MSFKQSDNNQTTDFMHMSPRDKITQTNFPKEVFLLQIGTVELHYDGVFGVLNIFCLYMHLCSWYI